MKRRHKPKPEDQRKLVRERISKLFKEADDIYMEKPVMADRYVQLARKLAMKYKVKLTTLQKRKFCSHCYKYKRGRTRLRDKKLVYYCPECKRYTRTPYK
ncbi:MAG: ribonuclease P [archaeon]